MRALVAGALCGGLLALAGCPLDDATYAEGKGGAGGGDAVTSTSTSTTTSTSSGGGMGGAGGGCNNATDCPAPDNECLVPTCDGGVCGSAPADPSTPISRQIAGDCKLIVCDGSGQTTEEVDDRDLPVDDLECTDDECTAGVPSNPDLAIDTSCEGTKFCDGAGTCVACTKPGQCASLVCEGNTCQAPACDDGVKNGNELGVDCGGACVYCPLLAAYGAGAAVTRGAQFAGNWTVSALTGQSTRKPGIALLPSGQAVAVFASSAAASQDILHYSLLTNGAWSAPAQIGPTVLSQAAPSLASVGGTVEVLFHGQDFFHYRASFDGVSWAPKAEKVGPVGSESFGPSAAQATSLGTDLVVTFAGNNGNLFDQTRTAGAWQAAHEQDLGGNIEKTVPPAIVAPTAGPELLIVYALTSTKQLQFVARTAGSWSLGANITNALSAKAPNLVALPGGSVLLAFQGTDDKLYWSKYTGAWSAPAKLDSANNPTLTTPPSLAKGFVTADAEAAWVDGAGNAQHARYNAGTGLWTASAPIGATGLSGIALVEGP